MFKDTEQILKVSMLCIIVVSPSTGEQGHQYAKDYTAPNTYIFSFHTYIQGKGKQGKEEKKRKDKQPRKKREE